MYNYLLTYKILNYESSKGRFLFNGFINHQQL